MCFGGSFQHGSKTEEETTMIPMDLIASLVIIAVAIYAAQYVYRAIKLSKLALIGKALIFYLFVIALDRIISAITIIAGVHYPVRVNNVIWCLYIVGISLIIWEIYNYLKSI